jgi:tetratricopeptide (TPR) repeat protein
VAAPARAAAPSAPKAEGLPTLTPLPGGPPSNPEAAALLEKARLLLREREFAKAVTSLEQAAEIDPNHPGLQKVLLQARVDARRTEIESLATAALNHFVQNDYKKARKAVDKALNLDPENKKAKELLKILVSLG